MAAKKHEIIILTRNVASAGNSEPGVTFRAVNYDGKSGLVEVLRGIHTVLSFTQLENNSQKNLIDAAIVAGVKRFAPSEWGRYADSDMVL